MAFEFVQTTQVAGFPPDPDVLLLMGTLIRNILDLNDIDAVDVASTAAADLMLLLGDRLHERSEAIWDFVNRAKTTVSIGEERISCFRLFRDFLLSRCPNKFPGTILAFPNAMLHCIPEQSQLSNC